MRHDSQAMWKAMTDRKTGHESTVAVRLKLGRNFLSWKSKEKLRIKYVLL